MQYYSNHICCHDSNWGGLYDCRHTITINRWKPGKCIKDGVPQDWSNLLEEQEFFNQKDYDFHKNLAVEKGREIDEERLNRIANQEAYTLKEEVVKWLNENVADRADNESPQGWVIGSLTYNANDGVSFKIFFHRRRDAFNFAKRWSEHKKPLSVFNYFTDKRQELDLETNKYITA